MKFKRILGLILIMLIVTLTCVTTLSYAKPNIQNDAPTQIEHTTKGIIKEEEPIHLVKANINWNSFSVYKANAKSAEVSIDFAKDESTTGEDYTGEPGDVYYDLGKAELYTAWDYDLGRSKTKLTSSDKLAMKWDHTDESEKSNSNSTRTSFKRYTSYYTVSGLKPSTKYNNLAIYIPKYIDVDGDKEITGTEFKNPVNKIGESGSEGYITYSDWSNASMDNDILPTDNVYNAWYKETKMVIVTTWSYATLAYAGLVIMGIIFLIFLVIFISLFVRWYRREYGLVIYGDANDSLAEKTFVYNLNHARRFKKLWDAPETSIKLIIAGRHVDAVFSRTPSLPDGYKISLPASSLTDMSIISLGAATKYNDFYVIASGKVFHANTILTKTQRKRVVKVREEGESITKTEEFKKSILNSINKREIGKQLRINKIENDYVSAFDLPKSTKTSVRWVVMSPEFVPMIDFSKFNPESKDIVAAHTYNGKLYKLNTEFVRENSGVYEWDISGLQPGRVYTGISISFDGGKKFFPARATYFTTRDEDDVITTIDSGILGAPKTKAVKSYPMWDKDIALRAIGQEGLDEALDLIVKKHYEEETGKNISLKRARKRRHEFDWLNEYE